jgi:hypothetical protein
LSPYIKITKPIVVSFVVAQFIAPACILYTHNNPKQNITQTRQRAKLVLGVPRATNPKAHQTKNAASRYREAAFL